MVQNISQPLSSPGRLSQKVLKRRGPQRHKDKKSFLGLAELRSSMPSCLCGSRLFTFCFRSWQKEWPAIPVFDSFFSKGFSAFIDEFSSLVDVWFLFCCSVDADQSDTVERSHKEGTFSKSQGPRVGVL